MANREQRGNREKKKPKADKNKKKGVALPRQGQSGVMEQAMAQSKK